MSVGMPHEGAPKLVEEMSELTKVLARIIAGSKTGMVDGKPIEQALREELADVVASFKFFCTKHGVRAAELQDRVTMKFERYQEWDKE